MKVLRRMTGPMSLMVTFALGAGLLLAQAPAPDNTKKNQRDRNPGAVTADQQKETAADRDITKRIRQAITDDKSLSLYAHNVKVVTINGTVTLKGPVRSEAEKNTIEEMAVKVAGAGKVTNQLEVKPATK